MKGVPKVLCGAAIVFVASLCGIGLAQDEAARPVATGKSVNWEVIVVKASTYTQDRVSPYTHDPRYLEPPVYKEDCFNLALDLRLEYLGPPGDIVAPSLSAVDENGNVFHAMGNILTSTSDLDALGWLITLARREPDSRRLEGGETFGADEPITFFIGDIPKTTEKLTIVFADVPPIPVTPTPL